MNETTLNIHAKRMGVEFTKINNINDLLNSVPQMCLSVVSSNFDLNDNIERTKTTFKKGQVIVLPFYHYLNIRKTTDNKKKVLKPYRRNFNEFFNRYKGQDLSYKKVLIWRSGGIGDLLFIQPVVKYLKDKFNGIKIIFSTQKKYHKFFNTWSKGLIDKVIDMPFDKEYLSLVDYHISFQDAIEKYKESEYTNCYDIMKLVSCCNDLDLNKYKPTLDISNIECDNIKLPSGKNIIIQLNASSIIRTMNVEKWVPVINSLNNNGFNVILLDNPNLNNAIDNYIKLYNLNRDYVFNYSSYSTNLEQLVYIISQSHGVAGIDSSYLHIGAALNKPLFGIFASFDAKCRLSTYDNCIYIQAPINNDICSKQPCFYHQHNMHNCKYVKQHTFPKCFDNISNEMLIEYTNKFGEMINECN